MSRTQDAARNSYRAPYVRNLLLNGSFQVWQRNTSFTAAVNVRTADMWVLGQSGTTGVVDVDKVEDAGANMPADLLNYLEVDVTTADASMAAGDNAGVATKIEGINLRQLGWHNADTAERKDVTVSFWTAHTKTGTNCVAIRNHTGANSYVAEYTQAVANTWEKHTITVPAATAGTWATTEGTGTLLFQFTMCAGSTYHTTADAWQVGNYLATSSQVNNYDSTANFFRVAGVQMEIGTEASDFEHLPYAMELAMCQRYYCKTSDNTTYYGNVHGLGALNGTGTGTANRPLMMWRYPVAMCKTPTLRTWNPNTGTASEARNLTTSANYTALTTSKGTHGCTVYPSATPAAGDHITVHVDAEAAL